MHTSPLVGIESSNMGDVFLEEICTEYSIDLDNDFKVSLEFNRLTGDVKLQVLDKQGSQICRQVVGTYQVSSTRDTVIFFPNLNFLVKTLISFSIFPERVNSDFWWASNWQELEDTIVDPWKKKALVVPSRSPSSFTPYEVFSIKTALEKGTFPDLLKQICDEYGIAIPEGFQIELCVDSRGSAVILSVFDVTSRRLNATPLGKHKYLGSGVSQVDISPALIAHTILWSVRPIRAESPNWQDASYWSKC